MGLKQHVRAGRFARRRAGAVARVEAVESRLLLAAAPIDKAHPLGKLDHSLRNLHADFAAFVRANNGRSEGFRPADKLVRARGSSVAIEAVANGDPQDLVRELKALGMRDVSVAGVLAGGLLPIDALDDLAGKASVRFARTSVYVTMAEMEAAVGGAGGEPSVTFGGATTSQADAAMRADDARAQFGVNGAGSVVGIISDSFNTGPGSYAADVSSGDLPSGVNVLADLANQTDEGRAMAQLVHDVAPGAGLAFHTSGLDQATFANGITALRTTGGADVIVDDILFLAEPMFQDGVIAQSVDAAVAAGVPYFSAAGNQARRSYESAFRRGTTYASGQFPVANPRPGWAFFGGVAHDFNSSTSVNDPLQSFTLGPGQYIQASFQWDSPAASAGGAGTPNDLDVYVFDANGTTVLGGSAVDTLNDDPVELFAFQNATNATQTYNLMLVKYADIGPDPGVVKYVNFGSQHNFTEHVTNGSTTYGHANAAGASAVAASFYEDTPEFGQNPPLVESFSSRGGTPIYFNKSGARLATPEVRNKPRITAPDGTNTTFFGSDIVEDADSFPNFFGTSAAAPHAAAVAALMQDAAGFISPASIYGALESTAVDMDNPDTVTFDAGRDDATGFGLIRADLAIDAVVDDVPSAAPGTPDLLAATDTGSSNADDRTNRDNSSAAKNLQFSVPDTVNGALVNLYAGGVLIGAATASGTTTTVTTNGTVDLQDGTRSITARQTEAGKSESADSGALPVIIDTAPPTVDVLNVVDDPRTTPVASVEVQFGTAVTGFGLEDVTLTRDGVLVDVTGATLSAGVEQSGVWVYTVGNLSAFTGAVGDYVLSVVAPGGIADHAGNALVTGASDAWRTDDDDVPPQEPVTLRAVADTYTRDGASAGTNFGGDVDLIVKKANTAGSTREAFLRFDLTGVASVGTAKLRLFGRLGNANAASLVTTVYDSANVAWPEGTTNWNNRPLAGTTVRGTITVTGTTAKWYELDLTGFLQAEKAAGRNLVTLALKNLAASDPTTVFTSDEAAANRPELVIEPPAGPPPQALVVSTANLSVPEGGNAPFTVKLAVQPASDVVVTVAKAGGGDGDLSTGTTSLTFTSANWDVAQSVSIAAADDADTANGMAQFTLTAGELSASVTATEADNDVPAAPVTLRAAADTYARDGTSAGTNFGTAAELIVKKSSSAGSNRESFLRFDLSSVESIGAAKLRLFGRLGNTNNPSLTTTVYDSTNTGWSETGTNWNNRPAAGTTVRGTITVTGTTAKWYELDLTSFLAAEKAAGRNLVTLVLRNLSTSDATTNFVSDEGAAANRPQLVIEPPSGPPPQGLVVSAAGISVPEGGNAAFTVKLAVQPASDVTVTVAKAGGGDGDLTTATTTLTFTAVNWDTAQSVSVSAAEDADTTNGTASFTVSSAGLPDKSVTATEADNDAPVAPTVLRAGADAYVRDGDANAGTNFGTSAQLQVKQGSVGWNRESYLRFDLSSVASVGSATLRLFGKLDNTAAASAGFTVFNSANTTWSETGVTFNSKLTAGTTVRGSGTVTGTTGQWYEIDLTTFLAAEKAAGRNLVTLVIRATAASASTIVFDSDEAANRPELVVS